MEHLWSTAEATHGTRPRTAASRNPLSYLRSVAGGRDQLRPPLCAREGSTAVRRGSTVRVRQTAFEKARKSGSRVVSTESQAGKGHARLGHCPDFAEALPFCFGAQRSVGAAEVARPRRLLNVRPAPSLRRFRTAELSATSTRQIPAIAPTRSRPERFDARTVFGAEHGECQVARGTVSASG